MISSLLQPPQRHSPHDERLDLCPPPLVTLWALGDGVEDGDAAVELVVLAHLGPVCALGDDGVGERRGRALYRGGEVFCCGRWGL